MDIGAAEVFGLNSRYDRPGVMAREHRHKEIEMNFLLQGSMTYLFAGITRVVPAGRLAVFWATFPHQVIRVDDDPVFFCLHFPLANLFQCSLPSDLNSAILNGALVIDERLENAAIDRVLLPRWHEDLQDPSKENLRTVQLEIEARLRRIVWHSDPAQRIADKVGILHPFSGAAKFERLEQMTSYIAANYTESLTIADIARVVDLHPKYVMSLFRKSFGMTIGDYITQHRVSHAQRLLATTNDKVISIGYDAGFGSTSRFYEVFEGSCGVTPMEFRRSVHGK